MTENHNAGVDPSTLHNVPDGLLDTHVETASGAAAAAFTPPYADAVIGPDAVTAPLDGPPVADVPDVPTWSAGDEPALPPTPPTEQAGFAPSSDDDGGARSLLRRWGAPAALVAAGLLGGMAATAAVTSATASTPSSSTVERPGAGRAEGGRQDGGADGATQPGVSVDELAPDAAGDGRHDHHDTDAGFSLSDGFTLHDSAATTHGTTGASR